jgi:hypothetical protein
MFALIDKIIIYFIAVKLTKNGNYNQSFECLIFYNEIALT